MNGADRAEYGARLLENLSSRLADGGMDGVASRSLRQYRQFYLIYPVIWQAPSAKAFEPPYPIFNLADTACQISNSCAQPKTTCHSSVRADPESHDQLLDKLQDFLLELGHGFCFEARQKRILIGDTYNFVDLVVFKYQLELPKKEDMQRFIEEQIRETES